MGNTIAPFIFALLMVGIVLELVRRKVFREKYAALWLIIGIGALVLAGWPGLLSEVSKFLGVQVASNLLFALCIVLLLGVCLHLSWELSVVEDENRTLAEEVAILRSAVERIDMQLNRVAPARKALDESLHTSKPSHAAANPDATTREAPYSRHSVEG
ncbi:hypothetical protein Asphe3_25480 [Pseudarthrobacter phenanthrenivorans Sphe3]|uniref:DUF2304 domain-containing protein n=1 Tax=Pseudarthrobacter phenanthrenivorans (strain DSM 18606 / JCM 16027 / LMG 23796 / Sphe3) TaxID=930171 RepID=F0M7F5_PSEPM|nr:DUF2304 domain-containing protein [Pseudarthrobacter phenanthrenivorans]ADX73674.1 hypothetical protein Asphe3_25480 [Pseudarthrobacter phenanthrenivorans Sphe3]